MVLNINDKIKKLKNCINNSFKIINKESCIRNRKILFSDVFYFINLYNSNQNVTYDKIYNKLICDETYCHISKNAFVKKRNDLQVKHFDFINNNLIKFIYKDLSLDNKSRFLSVDSSNLYFLNKLCDDFKSNKHNTYTTAHLSCLFDVDLQIPVNYNLSYSSNERKLLEQQFPYIRKNDILIADRGYYSDELINKFIDNKFNFIFRVKISELKVKMFEKLDSKSNIDIISDADTKYFLYDHKYNNKIFKFKIIKYQTYFNKDVEKENIDELKEKISFIKKNIDFYTKIKTDLLNDKKKIIDDNKNINLLINNDKIKKNIIKSNMTIKKNIDDNIKKINYNIDTFLKTNNIIKQKINLINKVNDSVYYIVTNKIELTNDKIKELYKKRWDIETHFRFAKDKFKMRTMETKSLNLIKQNIYATQFIFLLEGYFEYLIHHELNNNKKINKSSFIDLFHNYLIKHLLLSKNNKKTSNTVIKILLNLIKGMIKITPQVEMKPRVKKRPGSKFINIIVTT
jgi:hypothetical protein